MGSNNQMLPLLLLVACCCCSSSASGAGAYFLGYVPGNDKYYIRIFQLEKMFQILEDIKNDMVYEGTAPNKYTGKINGTDFCDEVKDFYENYAEKRDDEVEKVTDADFTKLVENYMDDNEIKGYTYRQAMNVIEFLYASCGTDDKRVFKKTADFTDKLTNLFTMKTPPTENTWTARKDFCDSVTDAEGLETKGFTGLHKEITDVTAVSSLAQVWDGDTGTMGVSGFSLTDLTSSVDYCANTFAKTCAEIGGAGTTTGADCDDAATCAWDAGTDAVVGGAAAVPGSCGDALCSEIVAEDDCPTSRCEWTADVMSTDGVSVVTEGSCGIIPPECSTFKTAIDCPTDTRCDWTDAVMDTDGLSVVTAAACSVKSSAI
jgi:hypothetical protein